MVDARGEATGIARKIGGEWFGRKQADGGDGPRGGRVFKRGPGLVEGKETGDGMRSGCAGAADRTMCGRGSVLPPGPPFFFSRVYFSFEPSESRYFGSFCEVCPAVLHRLYYFFFGVCPAARILDFSSILVAI